MLGAWAVAVSASRLAVAAVTMSVRALSFKTKSGAKKRFRLTGSGTFKHAKAGRQHLATGDTRKTIRDLGKPSFVTNTDRKTLLKLIKAP